VEQATNVFKLLTTESEGKKQHERDLGVFKRIILKYIEEIWSEDMEWIHLTKVILQWWPVVHTISDIPYEAGMS
jgi:hypothetical protein